MRIIFFRITLIAILLIKYSFISGQVSKKPKSIEIYALNPYVYANLHHTNPLNDVLNSVKYHSTGVTKDLSYAGIIKLNGIKMYDTLLVEYFNGKKVPTGDSLKQQELVIVIKLNYSFRKASYIGLTSLYSTQSVTVFYNKKTEGKVFACNKNLYSEILKLLPNEFLKGDDKRMSLKECG